MTAEVKKGCGNWELLQRFVATEERNDPKLKRLGERFRRDLAKRQARNLAHIMTKPDSKAYRDYIETPAKFAPGTARRRTKKRKARA